MKYVFEVNRLGDNSMSISVNIQDISGQTSSKRIMTIENFGTMEPIDNKDVYSVLKEVLDDMRLTVKEREEAELNLLQFIEYIQKSKNV